MHKPYVVSGDIFLLMKEWAAQNKFMLPEKKFFCQLREKFSEFMRQIFPGYEFVSDDEIYHGLNYLASKSNLLSISLDRAYFHGDYRVEIARLVDEWGQDKGLGPRAGTPPISVQIKEIQTSGVTNVVLVDDVIFSGEVIVNIIDSLSKEGINTSLVCAGIGIAEGINRIKTECEVNCVRTYEEVIDEVCERDFYPGVPLSGRLVVGNGNIGAPYILPFGNPVKWASIPAGRQVDFSKFCIKQTIALFEEIENLSTKAVACRDVGRKLVDMPNNNTRFVDFLRSLL